jgi:hypothetical protein
MKYPNVIGQRNGKGTWLDFLVIAIFPLTTLLGDIRAMPSVRTVGLTLGYGGIQGSKGSGLRRSGITALSLNASLLSRAC